MNVVSYVDILEVVFNLKDFKSVLIEGEDIVNKNCLDSLSAVERSSGVYDISAVCHCASEVTPANVYITLTNNPHTLNCKCSCSHSNSGKCKHVIATLIYVHRNGLSRELIQTVKHEVDNNHSNDLACGNDGLKSEASSLSSPSVSSCKRLSEGSISRSLLDTDSFTVTLPKPTKEDLGNNGLSAINNTSHSGDKGLVKVDDQRGEEPLADKRTGRGLRKRTPNPKYSSDSKKFPRPISSNFSEKSPHHNHLHQSCSSEKPFECDVCGQQFAQRRTLLRHENGGDRGCGSKLKLKCNVSDKSFDSQGLPDDRSISHSDQQDLKCTQSAESLIFKRGIESEMCIPAGNNLDEERKPSESSRFGYMCDECGKGFKKLVYLKQHKVSHSNIKPFECSSCGKRFSRQYTLNSHKNQHCKDPKASAPRVRPTFMCETCKKVFTNRMHHEEHVRSHTGERPFQCVECGKGFASKRSLRNHSHDGPNSRKRPHTCSQCSASFATAFMLKTHERSHTGEKPWVCSECGKAYRSQHVFQDHLNHHRGIKAHQCKECGKTFLWRTSLWAHLRDHSKAKPFECVQCGAMFAEQSELKDHWGEHVDDKPHQCPDCGLGFMQQEDCDKHVETHKKEPSHLCSQCGIKFIRADELNRHMFSHKEKRKCLCPNCGQTFSSKGHLKVHMLIHSGVKPFECETCSKRFYTRSLLRKHTVFHSDVRPFECVLCGVKFATQGILRAHVRTHTGERPFACEVCGKSFLQSTYLKRHALTHSGERPFSCSQCDSAYLTRYDLKVHMRTHTGEKPYGCDECTEQFYERAQLKAHQRTHTGERPFVCDLCGKGFNSSNHVRKHFGRVHPDSAPFPCPDCDERFILCEALRKHRKCSHLTGEERTGQLVHVTESKKALTEQKDISESMREVSVAHEKDPLNQLIEDSEILIEDHTESNTVNENGIIPQRIQIVEVPEGTTIMNLVETSEIQMKLPGFECETVQVFHTEPVSFSRF